jgi:hypothetical protein
MMMSLQAQPISSRFSKAGNVLTKVAAGRHAEFRL